MCRCLRSQEWIVCQAEEPSEPVGARDDAGQTKPIQPAWNDRGKIYGYRKLHDDLLDLGETCCPNRAGQLTRLAGARAQIGGLSPDVPPPICRSCGPIDAHSGA